MDVLSAPEGRTERFLLQAGNGDAETPLRVLLEPRAVGVAREVRVDDVHTVRERAPRNIK